MARLTVLILVSISACEVVPPTPNCEVWGVSAVFDGGEDMRPAPVCFIRCGTGWGHTATEYALQVDCDQWEGRQVAAQRL